MLLIEYCGAQLIIQSSELTADVLNSDMILDRFRQLQIKKQCINSNIEVAVTVKVFSQNAE